jgi:uncharacterized protein (TIGR00255 family)
MTAYARAETSTDEFGAVAEIRSVNSRHLDIALRLPSGYLPLEDSIKGLITERLNRGRVEVKLQVRNDSEETLRFQIDTRRAQSYRKILDRLKDEYHMVPQMPFGFLIDSGIVIPVEIQMDAEQCWSNIQPCISEALDRLVDMRIREGDFIAGDIRKRLDALEDLVRRIDRETNGLIERCQQRLKERIENLTKGLVELDPSRIAQEAAFFASRSDISEELVRASSHIRQFREIMETDEPTGQKLNFLLQELHRECNTMGSKTEKATISHIVVEIKSELEKIREQVQNIE